MNNEQAEMPRQWFCPITQQLIKDPAIASDGFTYERAAILQWFKKSNHSPLTNLPLANTNLIPNYALRRTIQQYIQKHQPKALKLQLKLPENQLVKPNYELPNIQINIDSAVDSDELYVRCEVQPPLQPQLKRNACSIICILDVSESMETDSVMGGKDLESHGFSRLDLVKHSISTMVEFMEDTDEIALVPFSTSARIALPLTRTTAAGKNLIKQTTKNLQTIGTTNIWDGFKVSMQILKQLNKRQKYHNIFVVLLTDGQPNLNPPRGIVPTLIKFLDLEKLPTPNIHVFGYGYELDTNLLAQIAQVGHGTYTYIPDCSMVGTAFVNFMATALSTITNDLTLRLTDMDVKSQLKQIVGFKKTDKGDYNMGILQYGQRRQFVLKFPSKILNTMQITKIGNVMVSYGQQKVFQKQISLKSTTQNTEKMMRCILRSKYLAILNKLMKQKKNNIANCEKIIDEFYQLVQWQHQKLPTQFTQVLLKQLKNTQSQNEGQVAKAFQKQQWFVKWGRHYIPSLFRAHLMQICTNFKDPALQIYGGPMFEQNRSNMDTIFIKMPPPQPSAKKVEKLHYLPVPADMSDYYNYEGGCIHGDCWVGMKDGTKKMVKQLKKGDHTQGGIIKCIVKTNVFTWVQMSRIGNLIITPWHPIKIDQQWIFPSTYAGSKTQKIFIEAYYNFVMQQNSVSIICEGIQCISLGHRINDNPVTSHQYLSGRIIEDLHRSKGWPSGQITISRFLRDSDSKRIVGLELNQLED